MSFGFELKAILLSFLIMTISTNTTTSKFLADNLTPEQKLEEAIKQMVTYFQANENYIDFVDGFFHGSSILKVAPSFAKCKETIFLPLLITIQLINFIKTNQSFEKIFAQYIKLVNNFYDIVTICENGKIKDEFIKTFTIIKDKVTEEGYFIKVLANIKTNIFQIFQDIYNMLQNERNHQLRFLGERIGKFINFILLLY